MYVTVLLGITVTLLSLRYSDITSITVSIMAASSILQQGYSTLHFPRLNYTWLYYTTATAKLLSCLLASWLLSLARYKSTRFVE